MDLDALLTHYFGTSDIEGLDAQVVERGADRIRIDFATERDAGRRFALWALLATLGQAPDPGEAFEDVAERRAAELYLRVTASGLSDD